MSRRAIGLVILALAVGCQSGGSSTTGERGPLRDESATRDPGLPGGSGLTRSTVPGSQAFEVIYFDFDEATLRADAQAALRRNASVLKEDPDLRVEIHGHCDERGTEEYNLALGQRRAQSAKRYLVDLGIGARRIVTKTFGEASPAVWGHDEGAWAKNRRDEFVAVK